jgi:hypothetical protein
MGTSQERYEQQLRDQAFFLQEEARSLDQEIQELVLENPEIFDRLCREYREARQW